MCPKQLVRVSLETAEHTSTRLGPALAISKQTSMGSKRNSGSLCLTRAPGNVRWRPLSTHHTPVPAPAKRRMTQGQSSTIRTDLTKQTSKYPDTHAPMCSDSMELGKPPCKANTKARERSTAPLKWKLRFGKAVSAGLIQHGTQETTVQSDRL